MKDFFVSRFSTISSYLHTQKVFSAEWKNLLTLNYYQQLSSSADSAYGLFTGLLIVLLVAVLLVWRSLLKRANATTPIYQPVLDQLANLVFFISITSFAYLLFRLQEITYLSGPVVLLFIIIITLGWIAYSIYYVARVLPAQRQSYLEKERFFRYLPKRK